jgi:hypothetical protein
VKLGWRIGLVGIVAAAVLGGLVPHVTVQAAETTTTVLEAGPLLVPDPVNCADATCDKGSPAPASPSPTGTVVAVLATVVAAAAALCAYRNRREQVAALAPGSPDPLFHPPQFA